MKSSDVWREGPILDARNPCIAGLLGNRPGEDFTEPDHTAYAAVAGISPWLRKTA